MYKIYSDENVLPIKPEKIIVEDSNSGYDFFHSVSEDQASEEYIESSEFFSWERYFTKLLIEQTKGTYLKYKKSRLKMTARGVSCLEVNENIGAE